MLEVLESARELGRAGEPLAGCPLLQSGLSQTPEALWRWGAGQPPQLRLGAPWGTVTMLCMLQAGKLDATAVAVLGGTDEGIPRGAGSAPPVPPAPGGGSLSRGRAFPTPTPPTSPLLPGLASGKCQCWGRGRPVGDGRRQTAAPPDVARTLKKRGPQPTLPGELREPLCPVIAHTPEHSAHSFLPVRVCGEGGRNCAQQPPPTPRWSGACTQHPQMSEPGVGLGRERQRRPAGRREVMGRQLPTGHYNPQASHPRAQVLQ